MIASLHGKEGNGNFFIELMKEDSFQGADDLRDFPVMLGKDGLVMFLRKSELEELQFLAQSALQELDKREIEKWKL